VTSFHDLADYVAIPRVTALRLSPDGSWLAAAVQTVGGRPPKYVTSIWRVAVAGAGPPARLTRSAEGEGAPEFLPDGSLLFLSKRPGPAPEGPGEDGEIGQDQPALWRLPAGGGEARRLLGRPGGVTGIATAREAGTVVLASPGLPGASDADEDQRRRKARKDAGVTAILHASGPVRYWDHDLGPDSPRLLAAEIAGDGAHAAGGPAPVAADEPVPEARNLTPEPGRALDEQTFDAAPDGSLVVTGWSAWDETGDRADQIHVIDTATGQCRVLLAAPGYDFNGPRVSPDGRLVACRRATHDTYDAPGDVTLVIAPLAEIPAGPDMPAARAGPPAGADGSANGTDTPPAPPAGTATTGTPTARAGPPARAGGEGAPGGSAPRSGGPGVTPRDNTVIPQDVTGTDVLAGLDRRPLEIAWAPDGGAVYFTADDQGRRPVFRVDLATGEITRLTADHGGYESLCPAPDGRFVYALRSSVDEPPTPVRIDVTAAQVTSPGGEPVRLACPGSPLEVPGRLEEVQATAGDGAPVRAWLVLPAAASRDEPAPLLLWVHGGPVMSWNAWSWRWNPWLMAAQGYAVLLPDPALSTGYGHHFIARGHGQWGGQPYADLMAITDAAAARPDIDPARTAMMGGSYGGYMANWIAGHTGRFRAIVSHAGLWALDQMFGTTDLPSYWRRIFGDPATRPERYLADSPNRHVGQISTPMLVIHGDRDYRVPVGEALRLWWDLQGRRNDARFLYFPDENHWILKPGHVTVWYETVLAFLAQHVLGEEWQRPELL
jgi:dipeptidyl aminopeptidase/acylaminoacyl peptidase